ncbi:cell wall hydrolase [Sphingomonas morindae]|uniref:Cell wall hydrolase n=1 Tax=Sphingomonas morindae TaxID=1541170 RepID=A0ABY4XDG9_9SPHN|nr:cell wall hydrolase [Sphingomonas morindae]USI74952.1 cell wall hydrolase [Sphingomonas morindae]
MRLRLGLAALALPMTASCMPAELAAPRLAAPAALAPRLALLSVADWRYGPEVTAAAPQFGGATGAGDGLACLTAALYYEARSEGVIGERAVAQVVLNRVRAGRFGSDLCAVVYQGREAGACQFAFACDGALDRPRDRVAWHRAALVAQIALREGRFAPVGDALYYHAGATQPGWAAGLSPIAAIGRHFFYGKANSAADAPLRLTARDALAAPAGVRVHHGDATSSEAVGETMGEAMVQVHVGAAAALPAPPAAADLTS